MSKTQKNKVKVRKKWKIHPATQIHSVDTKEYNRSRARREWEEEMEEELFSEDDLNEEYW